MTEKEWVKHMAKVLAAKLAKQDSRLSIEVGMKIPYGYEIRSYGNCGVRSSLNEYETDLVILEREDDGAWKPRVIVEAKLRRVTTHDAITYSQKAHAHKTVHPYLRYGIMLGARKHYPLPGRLYRHGAYFDFMVSFSGERATESELASFVDILLLELDASRRLEKIIYESRKPDRDHYRILHKRLILE